MEANGKSAGTPPCEETGVARSVAMLEQMAGVFYIARVVSRLIGIRAAKAAAEEAQKAASQKSASS